MWFVLFGVGLFAAGMAAEHVIERAARSRARFDAQIAAFERQITVNRAPRHAARSPRGTPGGAMVPGETPGQPLDSRPVRQHPPALARDPGGPWYWRQPAPGTPPRAVTTAADIAPVFLPAPGVTIPMRPQPGRDSGIGTGLMWKVTDTGELRIATDKFIAKMERDGAAYRKELTS